MGIVDIQGVLPHRYPFLFVDRVTELEKGRRAVGFKTVTVNEPFFQGHFPGNPIMPGVLIVEAIAQVGAVLLLSLEGNEGKIALFAGIDGMRFRRVVVPGDTLRLEVEVLRVRGRMGKAHGKASVDGETVAEGDILFALQD